MATPDDQTARHSNRSERGFPRRDLLKYGAAIVAGSAIGGIAGYEIGAPPAKEHKAAATVKIGAVVPKGEPLLGEGQEMSRGIGLAIKIVNDRHGLGGKPVELVLQEVPDLTETSMGAAAKALVAQEVQAVFLGFTSPTCAEFATYADHGAPVFHLAATQASLGYVTDHDVPNIFRCVPAPPAYGPRFAALLGKLSGALPPNQTAVQVLTTDDVDGAALANGVRAALGPVGWTISGIQRVALPVEDWNAVLGKLTAGPPGAIFLGISDPRDLAGFQKAFVAHPSPSLVYATFGPSVPEYLELAGSAADGVVWSTPVGTLPTGPSKGFFDLYGKKFKGSAGLSQSGAFFDMVQFWAQCAALAKHPSKFAQVGKIVPTVAYRGVSGTYSLTQPGSVPASYPDGTKDPSLGLPHLTFQIQGQKQVVLDPTPYVNGSFVKPRWL